jgi:hypothetical protein
MSMAEMATVLLKERQTVVPTPKVDIFFREKPISDGSQLMGTFGQVNLEVYEEGDLLPDFFSKKDTE